MADRELTIGLVGCGGIAKKHAAAYARAGARIAAVTDVFQETARAMAEQTGARAFDSVEAMLDAERLGGASVCTPPAAHLENCTPLLRAGVGVLCEKPLELSLQRARALAAQVESSGAPFMTAFCHRFHPPILALKQLLPEMGRPLLFRCLFGGYLELTGNHRADPAVSGGGCLADHGAHAMDLFRFLVGEVRSVEARAGDAVQDVAVEDIGVIRLESENGAYGQIASSYSMPVGDSTVEFYTSGGAAVVTYFRPDKPELVVRKKGERDWRAVDCFAHPDRFDGEIAHFLDCLRTGGKPSVTADDGLAAARITDAVYRSAREESVVTLSSPESA